jgi:hypothetical protein
MDPAFRTPPRGNLGPSGSYDLNGTSVWRIRIKERQVGRVALLNGGGLTVRSNNSQVVPNDATVFKTTQLASGPTRIVEFYGLSPGTSMIEAYDGGDVATYIQVQVSALGGPLSMIELDPFQMALNSWDTPVPYKMKYNKQVPGNMDPQSIINEVVAKTSMKHLVISCHGEADPQKGPFLALGSGFRMEHADLFQQLYPVVTSVIWIGACAVAGSAEGIQFCKRMAKASGCYVVAPGITIPRSVVGINQVEMFANSMAHYFDPDGNAIGGTGVAAGTEFFKLGQQLGFRLVKVTTLPHH